MAARVAARLRASAALLVLCCAVPGHGAIPTHHAAARHRATRFEEEEQHVPISRRSRARPGAILVAARKNVDLKPPRLFGVRTLVITALLARYRLTAFVSEVGESIRPLQGVLTWHVNLFYLVSWLYVITDTTVHAVDEANVQGRRRQVARVVLFMSIFHSIATMLIPAVAIHEAVHFAMALLKRAAASPRIQLWVPTMVGLSLIPAMPIVDEPLHHVLKGLFDRLWPEARAADAKELSARQHAA